MLLNQLPCKKKEKRKEKKKNGHSFLILKNRKKLRLREVGPLKVTQRVSGWAGLECGLLPPEPLLPPLTVLGGRRGWQQLRRLGPTRRNPCVFSTISLTSGSRAKTMVWLPTSPQITWLSHARAVGLHILPARSAGGEEEEIDPWSRGGEGKRHPYIFQPVLASLRIHNTLNHCGDCGVGRACAAIWTTCHDRELGEGSWEELVMGKLAGTSTSWVTKALSPEQREPRCVSTHRTPVLAPLEPCFARMLAHLLHILH